MSVQKLWKLARVFALNTDCASLRDIVLDLKFVAAPRSERPFVTAERLWKVGVALHAEGRVPLGAYDRDAANLLRDGLILAFLATYPLRAKNFAHLDLGRSIRQEDGAWWILLDQEETRNRRAAWKGSKTPNLAAAILQHGVTRITDAHYHRARTLPRRKYLILVVSALGLEPRTL